MLVYSKKDCGGVKLSNNFTVSEFACKDGADVVIIDELLVHILQNVRDYFKRPVHITSAYRTPSHNKSVGGATYSLHIYGKAADFTVDGVAAAKVQEYLEIVLPNTGGIGKAANYTHVDTRAVKARWTY